MPHSPTIEPTDKSMPPLRMTNVIPMARIALIATCLTRIERLPVVRNSGDSTEKRPTAGTSAMSARSRRTSRERARRVSSTGHCRGFAESLRAAGAHPGLPTPRTPARRRSHRRRSTSAGDAPSAITSTRVARRPDLGEVGRARRRSPGRSPRAADGLDDLGLRRHVHAARRLVQQQHARAAHDGARDDDLLLVAAAQRADTARRVPAP